MPFKRLPFKRLDSHVATIKCCLYQLLGELKKLRLCMLYRGSVKGN